MSLGYRVEDNLQMRRRVRWVAVALPLLFLGACVVSGGNRGAQLRSDGVFVYPPAAKEAHTEGYVVVVFDIDANGRVEAPHVMASAPQGVFDDAALSYVGGRVYEPARRDGHPSAVMGQRARVNFKLGDAAAYP